MVSNRDHTEMQRYLMNAINLSGYHSLFTKDVEYINTVLNWFQQINEGFHSPFLQVSSTIHKYISSHLSVCFSNLLIENERKYTTTTRELHLWYIDQFQTINENFAEEHF